MRRLSQAGSAVAVSLAWIDSGRGYCVTIRLPVLLDPPTFADALAHPHSRALIENLGLTAWSVHGRKRSASDPIEEGDRLELLSPLQVDPNQARLRRQSTRRKASKR